MYPAGSPLGDRDLVFQAGDLSGWRCGGAEKPQKGQSEEGVSEEARTQAASCNDVLE